MSRIWDQYSSRRQSGFAGQQLSVWSVHIFGSLLFCMICVSIFLFVSMRSFTPVLLCMIGANLRISSSLYDQWELAGQYYYVSVGICGSVDIGVIGANLRVSSCMISANLRVSTFLHDQWELADQYCNVHVSADLRIASSLYDQCELACQYFCLSALISGWVLRMPMRICGSVLLWTPTDLRISTSL